MKRRTSHTPTVSNSKAAFTFTELIVVILLIGVLYGVFLDRLQQSMGPKHKDADKVTLTNLKDELLRYGARESREVICDDNPCSECRLYVDGTLRDGVTYKLFEEEPTAYERDRYGQFRRIRFLPRYDEDKGIVKVCFRFKVFDNDSSSFFAVQTDDQSYLLFRPWNAPVTTHATLTGVEEALDTQALLPTERRHYNF